MFLLSCYVFNLLIAVERLRNLHIEAGVSPDDLSEIYYYDGVALNILDINFNKDVVGRYLKFWIEATDETLNICEIEVYGKVQSTLVISKSKGPSKTVRDIRTSTYQICSIEEKQFEQPNFTNDYVIRLL